MASSSSNNSVTNNSALKPPKKEKEEEQQTETEIAAEDIKPTTKRNKYSSTPEEIEKFQRYEAELSSYIMSKYFSDKTIFGGNIYDTKMTTEGGGTIKASSLPPYASYADPMKFWELMHNESSSEAESAATTSNGNQSVKKE